MILEIRRPLISASRSTESWLTACHWLAEAIWWSNFSRIPSGSLTSDDRMVGVDSGRGCVAIVEVSADQHGGKMNVEGCLLFFCLSQRFQCLWTNRFLACLTFCHFVSNHPEVFLPFLWHWKGRKQPRNMIPKKHRIHVLFLGTHRTHQGEALSTSATAAVCFDFWAAKADCYVISAAATTKTSQNVLSI